MTVTNPRTLLARLGIVAVLCAGAAAGAIYLFWPAGAPPTPPASASLEKSPAQSAPQPAPVPAAAPAPKPGTVPSFDVVRVGPQGAVLAGRAEPGATVVVANRDAALGRVQADPNGDWVLVSAALLVPGGRELSLSARAADGRDVSGATVVLPDVPGPPAAAGPATAPLASQDGAGMASQAALAADDSAQKTDVQKTDVQSPVAHKAEARKPGAARLGLDTVDDDGRGAMRFAGTAPPGVAVRVYVDNAPIGDTQGDGQGRWTLTPLRAPKSLRELHIDQLSGAGKVMARLELSSQRSAGHARGGRVVVQPGQTLWRLARHAYGAGMRYTVIYSANRNQIRDPGMIYPGQAFAIPVVAHAR